MDTPAQHICMPVYSSKVLSYDGTSILQEAGGFRPMQWFLESRHSLSSKAGEPPRKRRRTGALTDFTTLPDAGVDSAALIPLSRHIIDLHFPQTLTTEPPDPEVVRQDINLIGSQHVAISIREVKTLNDRGAIITLCLNVEKGSQIQLILDGIGAGVVRDLKQVAASQLLGTAKSRSTSSFNGASFATSTLTLSRGSHFRVVRLQTTLYWTSGVSYFPHTGSRSRAQQAADFGVLTHYFPDLSRNLFDNSAPWTPQDFYESAHVPPKDKILPKKLQDNLLDSELYPFQRRAVQWMLQREGVGSRGGQIDCPDETSSNADGSYTKCSDVDGQPCYVSHIEGTITSKTPETSQACLSGGLLAEEMGLGKTVELMALILLHRCPEVLTGITVHDQDTNSEVIRSRATLIITPQSILQQWKNELVRHAPNLKVLHYEGISKAPNFAKDDERLLRHLVNNYDVVLATYNTLAKELHFAEDPPERNLRHDRKYERQRSPLVQVQWWRICLDEAQMVESGVTAAARVACRLPRVHSWAVTGTPLRKNVQDLLGLLIFLRYKPYCNSAKLWNHLITNHRHVFKQIFGAIALRHTKAQIRDELRLPLQKRVVITVPFSAVEQNNYSTLFNEMCEDVGLNADGSPVLEDWDPEASGTIEMMRNWLVRLRQTCLHPQVGGRNRRALGRGQAPLRTVAEVLEVMIEQNETNTKVEERAHLVARIKVAHVLGNAGDDDYRSMKALDIYTAAMETSGTLVKDARRHLAKAKASKDVVGATVDTEDDDDSSESKPLIGRLRNNLRTALQLQHVCTFFAATACYQIKSNETIAPPESSRFKESEKMETGLYDVAKLMRKEVLRDAASRAERSMRKIQDARRTGNLTNMPPFEDLKELSGIEARRIVEKSDDLFDTIREVSKIVVKWRDKIIEFLLKPLVDEETEGIETTGEEYEDSTKQQDELYVYFNLLKAVSADMNTLITGESAPLIDHEMKTMLYDAHKMLDPDVLEEHRPMVHAPELTIKLLHVRNQFRRQFDEIGSIRGLILEARSLEGSMQWHDSSTRSRAELGIVEKHLAALQGVFSAQTKALSGVEKEVALYRTTQNQRLEFYRQLQELSDAVAPYKEDLDETIDRVELEMAKREESKRERALAALKTKHRFLLNLREESSGQTEAKICVICQSPFEQGVLTVCGHQYCKECIQHWWSEHRSCPVCKRKLNLVDFHEITYKPQELRAQEETHSGESSPLQRTSPATSPQSSIYSDVDSKILSEIKAIDLPGSYGTKIDTLARHLLWIRSSDPGAKSIVFSQYREFLDVLGAAFADFKVGYARLGRPGAVERFRHNASVDCLLLDAKTDSSGLTLVNATHVFICEPLIQTAVELQAIARVHRIGQTRPTTVWMYLISDTVEESIYEISVARRIAHLHGRDKGKRGEKSRAATPALGESALDAANSMEMQQAPLSKLLVSGKGGGEAVGTADLWQCLFGKAQKQARVGAVMEAEVGRHLRAEAAEARRDAVGGARGE